MSNLAKAILILNSKKKTQGKKCPDCGTTMKNGSCPECDSEDMTENAKKGGKSKGWTDEARKKAAATRKRRSKTREANGYESSKGWQPGMKTGTKARGPAIFNIPGKSQGSKGAVPSREVKAGRKVAKAAKAGAKRKTVTKPKSSAYGKKLSATAWKYEDKAGDSGSHADYQRAAKAHAAAAKHFKKAGDKKKAAYHERRFKKYNGQGSKYRGTSDGYGGTY